MSDGLDFPVGGPFTVTKDGRVVFTSNGRLVNLLPTVVSFTGKELIFPDFDKDNLYAWTYGVAYVSGTSPSIYKKGESCQVYITAQAQEYSDKIVLADAPAGADFFLGQVRIDRTTAPASTWMGRTLGVLPIENQWMPFMGSCLLEADYGMCRAMHVYLDDVPSSSTYRKLVLEAQQSVSVPPGGYDTSFGDNDSLLNSGGGGLVNGGNTASGSRNGLPIFARSGAKSYGYDTNPNGSAQPGGTSSGPTSVYRWDGSSPCSRSDPTSYTSIYSIDITGQFGRRS
jgi:hypothetical protein